MHAPAANDLLHEAPRGNDAGQVVAGSATVWLTDPAAAWLVRAGSVDVFAVEVDAGRPVGKREFLFTTGAGGVLFGAPPTPAAAPLALIAVAGEDARLERRGLDQRHPSGGSTAAGPVAADTIDAWVAGLSAGLQRFVGHRPHAASRIAASDRATLPAGQAVAGHRGVVWAVVRSGAALFMGSAEIPMRRTAGAIPLTPETWLLAREDIELEVRDTPTMLAAAEHWAFCLREFHAVFLTTLSSNLQRLVNEEAECLRQRTRWAEEATEQTLARFAAVLAGDDGVIATCTPDDLLLRTCDLVAKACGLKAVAPPPAAEGAADRRLTVDDIARASGFRIRQLTLRGEWWRADIGALVVFRAEDQRPMALLPTKGERYRLHDLADGTTAVLDQAAAATLSGVGYMLYPPLADGRLGLVDLLRFGARRCRKDLVTVLATTALGGLLGMAVPVMTAYLFDTVIPAHQPADLVQIGLALVIAAITLSIFRAVGDIAMLRIDGKIAVDLTAAVWDRLMRMPSTFHSNYSAGDLTSRVYAIDTVRQTLVQSVNTALVSGVYAIFSLGLLFLYAPTAAAVAALLVALLAGAMVTAGVKQYRAILEAEEINGRLAGMVFEIVSGIAKLRLMGAEERAFARWGALFAEARRRTVRAGRIANLFTAFVAGYEVLSVAAVFAAIALLSGGSAGLSTGAFLALITAFTILLTNAVQVARAGVEVLAVQPHITRARPIFVATPEQSVAGVNPGVLGGEIEVNHVHFRYGEGMPWVLRGVTIQVRPGQFVALVGGSGCGKSTLMKLLLGFEAPQAGGVYYDGHDLHHLDLQAVRNQIGVVLQNDRLTPGSIYENIVGATRCTVDEAWEAARLVGLAEDIAAMPMGLHTILTEGTMALSGGQVQRLLIARALVAKPPILLFDEATSALDNRTQATVTASLDRLAVTRVVIAHRLSTIVNADRIYVLGHGEVLESGTYEELIARDHAFAELARRQMV